MIETQIKDNLVDKIRKIEDPKIIREIYRLLEIDTDEDIYKTNDAQKKAINTALSEIKDGKTLTEQEVNEQTTEWLNKKK
jgi:formaldehyde-activating enzyme involved in methanogenesis